MGAFISGSPPQFARVLWTAEEASEGIYLRSASRR